MSLCKMSQAGNGVKINYVIMLCSGWCEWLGITCPCVPGLDFIWQMYLRNPDERVANLTKLQLLNLYHCHSLHAPVAAPIRKALVQ